MSQLLCYQSASDLRFAAGALVSPHPLCFHVSSFWVLICFHATDVAAHAHLAKLTKLFLFSSGHQFGRQFRPMHVFPCTSAQCWMPVSPRVTSTTSSSHRVSTKFRVQLKSSCMCLSIWRISMISQHSSSSQPGRPDFCGACCPPSHPLARQSACCHAPGSWAACSTMMMKMIPKLKTQIPRSVWEQQSQCARFWPPTPCPSTCSSPPWAKAPP